VITIDGATGRVWKGEVAVIGGELEGDVKELIDRLLKKHAIYPQADVPELGATTVLADWTCLSDKEIEARVAVLEEVSKLGPVMIDITSPNKFGTEDDKLVWQIAGYAPEADDFGARIVHRVIHSQIEREHCKVVGGDANMRELFELKEFDVLPQVNTVLDLLKQSGLVGISPELALSIAPDGDIRFTIEQFKKAGLFSGAVVTGSLPPAFAALQLLEE
jgi:hypothetical protein